MGVLLEIEQRNICVDVRAILRNEIKTVDSVCNWSQWSVTPMTDKRSTFADFIVRLFLTENVARRSYRYSVPTVPESRSLPKLVSKLTYSVQRLLSNNSEVATLWRYTNYYYYYF